MRRPIGRSPGIDRQPNMDSVKLQPRPKTVQYTIFPAFIPKYARQNFWIFVSVAVTAILLSILVFFLSRFSGSYFTPGYSIIIDGGSTGTRIHVFEFLNNRGNLILDFRKGLTSKKVNPGLSSFSENPNDAGMSLYELLEFAKRNIPVEHRGKTEIRLMATAGLRRLHANIQEAILESCRKVLRSSGFHFKDAWASLISGADEGIYAWVAANYALGSLGGDPRLTTGIIELGGASAQVTFVASEPVPPEFSHIVKIGDTTYNLYSHSFLDFGQNVAYESMQRMFLKGIKMSTKSVPENVFVDPCTPKGYVSDVKHLKVSLGVTDTTEVHHSGIPARGNFTECRSAALMLLQKDKDECLYHHCHIGSNFIPKLQGKFLATENFFYTSKFFGLPPTAFLSDLILAGQKFCEEDWIRLKKRYRNLREEELIPYCFSSAYIVALLHDSLGIALNDGRIEFADKVEGIPLDWALGAFILKMSHMGIAQRNWVVGIIPGEPSALLLLFLVSALLLFTAWSVSKWRKPHLKTIYDLEKGRYIVTRINH